MFRNVDTKVETLRRLPLFSGLPRSAVAAVARGAAEIAVPAGRVLIREGEAACEFFVLVDGEAVATGSDGTAASLGRGDFFGELALVAGAPRRATVVTTMPSRLLVMTEAHFRRLMRDVPQVELRVLRAFARRSSRSRRDSRQPSLSRRGADARLSAA